LLIRGSETKDGFKAQKFHEKCDGKGPTLLLLKIHTGEILGGYNHQSWNQKKINIINLKTNKSFIFRLNENNPENSLIGKPARTILLFNLAKEPGLLFGQDLCLKKDFKDENNYCKKSVYNSKIRDTSEKFSVEDYEVFQIFEREEQAIN
ncbi:11207_t:CDS:1, partial [Racocetra fulgida]